MRTVTGYCRAVSPGTAICAPSVDAVMLAAVMKRRDELISAIRAVLARHPYVRRAALFGSCARDEAGEGSDVDLLVAFGPDRPRGLSLYRLDSELEQALGRRVDVVQEHLLHPRVRQHAQRDMVVVL